MVLTLHDRGLACNSHACKSCWKRIVAVNCRRALQYESVARQAGVRANTSSLQTERVRGGGGGGGDLVPEPHDQAIGPVLVQPLANQLGRMACSQAPPTVIKN